MTHLQFLSTTFVQAKNKGEKRRKKRKKENDLGIKLMCCKLLASCWSNLHEVCPNPQVRALKICKCRISELCRVQCTKRSTFCFGSQILVLSRWYWQSFPNLQSTFFFFPAGRENIFGSLNHCLPQVRANSEETQKWAAVCILSAIDYIIMPYIYPATVVQQGRPKLGGNNPGLQYSKSLQTRQQQNVL